MHLEIWSTFTGHNHRELASGFSLSEQAIYRIIKRLCKEMTAKVQGGLFQLEANDGGSSKP